MLTLQLPTVNLKLETKDDLMEKMLKYYNFASSWGSTLRELKRFKFSDIKVLKLHQYLGFSSLRIYQKLLTTRF